MISHAAPAIEIRDLRVDYGSFTAVDEISLTVPQGEIFGLVGPNGAGKSSTFRVLATLGIPTYGRVKLCGLDLFEQTAAARRRLGYMPDLAPVPSDLKAWEFLDLFAHAHGLGNAAQRRERIAECLADVFLTDKRDAWCRELSRGQTQRLVLAKTLLHRPAVIVLDEPASGMDPLSRRDLRLTLRKLAADGAAVIISSHILSELADMCTSLGVMNQGKLLAAGPVDQVRETLGRSARTLTLTLLEDPALRAVPLLENQPAVRDIRGQGAMVSFLFSGSPAEQAALLTAVTAAGVPVRAFEEQKYTFEEILLQIAEENRTAHVRA